MVFLALLPALFLMSYIYKKDKVEKEPLPLLIKLFVLGALTVVPIIIGELLLEEIISLFVEADTTLFILLDNIIGVALVEEFFKRAVVKVGAWKHPAFNYQFDAIVYCVFSALGFAALENILYVMDGGLETAVLRAITAVPSHMTDGVIMGYFLGQAKRADLSGNKKEKKRLMRLSLWVPVLTHGTYDAAIEFGTDFAFLFWVVFVGVVYIWSYRCIKKSSQNDSLLQESLSSEDKMEHIFDR